MFTFIISIAATIGLNAASEPAWDDKEEGQCFDTAMTQPAMTGCADGAFKRADARLNNQWALTSAAFKRVDQANRESGRETGAFDSLLRGQRAWLTYRKATCHAQGLVNAGGTIRDMNELLCLAAITSARIKELIGLYLNPNSDEPL